MNQEMMMQKRHEIFEYGEVIPCDANHWRTTPTTPSQFQ